MSVVNGDTTMDEFTLAIDVSTYLHLLSSNYVMDSKMIANTSSIYLNKPHLIHKIYT